MIIFQLEEIFFMYVMALTDADHKFTSVDVGAETRILKKKTVFFLKIILNLACERRLPYDDDRSSKSSFSKWSDNSVLRSEGIQSPLNANSSVSFCRRSCSSFLFLMKSQPNLHFYRALISLCVLKEECPLSFITNFFS